VRAGVADIDAADAILRWADGGVLLVDHLFFAMLAARGHVPPFPEVPGVLLAKPAVR
jgi:hypothetical protein